MWAPEYYSQSCIIRSTMGNSGVTAYYRLTPQNRGQKQFKTPFCPTIHKKKDNLQYVEDIWSAITDFGR